MSPVIFYAILFFSFFVGVFAIYILFRNEWVYNCRTFLLHSNYDTYKKLPSYDKMVLKFWVWDVNKFLIK